MTALVLLLALVLAVAGLLWLVRSTRELRVGHQAYPTTTYRLNRLWWPGIVTRPG